MTPERVKRMHSETAFFSYVFYQWFTALYAKICSDSHRSATGVHKIRTSVAKIRTGVPPERVKYG